MAKKCGRYILTRVSLGLQVKCSIWCQCIELKIRISDVYAAESLKHWGHYLCSQESPPWRKDTAVRLQTEATLLVEKMGHFNFW